MGLNPTGKLTDQQEVFCQAYIVSLKATDAALKAKYSEKTAHVQGCNLLKNPKIMKRINELMAKRSERTEIGADYVINTIRDTIERCRQAKPVVNRKGEPVMIETESGEMAPAYKFDSNGVLKGCELLGKHLKLFTEKTEVSGPDGAPIRFHSMTDAELEQEERMLLEQLNIED